VQVEKKSDFFLRVRAGGVRCDGMGCNNNGMMAWDAIRRPHFAQLAALPCASLGTFCLCLSQQ
jgi:hypothetical protein